MTVNSKGQITIPRRIRDEMGFVPGSEVAFYVEADRLYLMPTEGLARGLAIVARMTGRGTVNMSTDDIFALTRGNE